MDFLCILRIHLTVKQQKIFKHLFIIHMPEEVHYIIHIPTHVCVC